MCCTRGYLNCAGLLDRTDNFRKCASGVNLVVDDNDALPLHITDDVHYLSLVVVPFASLLNDREWCVEEFCEGTRALCEAKVGHDDEVLGAAPAHVVGEEMHGGELIDRNVEESLQLALV